MRVRWTVEDHTIYNTGLSDGLGGLSIGKLLKTNDQKVFEIQRLYKLETGVKSLNNVESVIQEKAMTDIATSAIYSN